MTIAKHLQTIAAVGVAVACLGESIAVACEDETTITGGGSFPASCPEGSAEGEAIGSSNAATGSIQAELFDGIQGSSDAFGSLLDANDEAICFASDDEIDGLPGEFGQSGSFCANAVTVRVVVTE